MYMVWLLLRFVVDGCKRWSSDCADGLEVFISIGYVLMSGLGVQVPRDDVRSVEAEGNVRDVHVAGAAVVGVEQEGSAFQLRSGVLRGDAGEKYVQRPWMLVEFEVVGDVVRS